ncbi:MAG: M20/M25/M40 family metallo-hydrolase, partial [Polyangiaceae bacterium]|nr:M20/M25/M40 family metallo-hydrolase [Polyangiaceae bacterium]
MSDESRRAEQSPDAGALDPALAGLEPAAMWRHFGALARIPHETGNEAGVRAYARAFAARHGIACEVNEVGDVLLRVRADTRGPIVALQAHMDMVCVSRDGAPYDFAREPIRLKRAGDSIRADGTSLGADNGIGVAYALALAEQAEGPLEVLLTVDEERGFTGIQGVAPGWLRAKMLINLDSEEEGYLTIASAGALDFEVKVPGVRAAPAGDLEVLAVTVDGLKGGHSGVEIHKGRTNALKVVGQVLDAALGCGGVVFGMRGGTAPNVIPSAAKATVGVPRGRAEELRRRVAELCAKLATAEDPELRIDLAPAEERRAPLTGPAAAALVALLAELPSGVLVASPRDPAQPFVSNNVGIVAEAPDGGFELTLMSRSPSADELGALEARYRAIAEPCGAVVKLGRMIPGWAPDYESPLLATFQQAYRERYGKEAKLLEIHAGLECGALRTKYPGMDLISVGPDITGVHSPD